MPRQLMMSVNLMRMTISPDRWYKFSLALLNI